MKLSLISIAILAVILLVLYFLIKPLIWLGVFVLISLFVGSLYVFTPKKTQNSEITNPASW